MKLAVLLQALATFLFATAVAAGKRKRKRGHTDDIKSGSKSGKTRKGHFDTCVFANPALNQTDALVDALGETAANPGFPVETLVGHSVIVNDDWYGPAVDTWVNYHGG